MVQPFFFVATILILKVFRQKQTAFLAYVLLSTWQVLCYHFFVILRILQRWLFWFAAFQELWRSLIFCFGFVNWFHLCLLHSALLVIGRLHTLPICQAGKAADLSSSTIGDGFRSRTGVIVGERAHPWFSNILYGFDNFVILVTWTLCVLLALFESAFEPFDLPWITKELLFHAFNFFVGVMHFLEHISVVMNDYSFWFDESGQPVLRADIGWFRLFEAGISGSIWPFLMNMVAFFLHLLTTRINFL